MHRQHLTIAIFIATFFFQVSHAESSLSAQKSIIGNIELKTQDVFDLSKQEENNWLFRLANRLHVVTKDRVIRGQLLFETGEKYNERLIKESERILRQNPYLYDANIKTTERENGTVDLEVITKDVWTLGPDLSLSRKGGENKSRFGIEEQNLFGLGQKVRFNHEENIDRRSNTFEFSDRHLGQSWVSMLVQIANSSDGETQQFRLIRPFYALDTRWSSGIQLFNNAGRGALYILGNEAAEYKSKRKFAKIFGGWSRGLRGGWAKRWTAGVVFDQAQFSDSPTPTLPSALPADRKLVYPFLGFELLQNEFGIARNLDQIGRTEDFLLGVRFAGSLGWADHSLGADRDALLYFTSISRGFGSLKKKALLLSANGSGRLESGNTRNAIATISARYYQTQSQKRLFFATLQATVGVALDLDNPVQLGGDSGLRGYPLRYQNGKSKILMTIEQRYFTDWYPFRLVRVGGAVFADVGRVWGDNSLGGKPLGWLADVGIGLRFATTRSSSNKTIHLDVAFPLNGDDSIDSVQIQLEAKRRF